MTIASDKTPSSSPAPADPRIQTAILCRNWQVSDFRRSPFIDDPELCDDLLERVASIRDVLADSAAESERLATLAPAAVEALTAKGLFRMRLSRDLGGFEASICTQILVIAALAEIDSASSWCTMVGNNNLGALGAFFPKQALDDFFSHGVPRGAGAAAASGTAIPVEGGYRVTGYWKFGSGIRHSTWVSCSVLIEGDPKRQMRIAVPSSEVTIDEKSWSTLGLRGTGSCDFLLKDHFIPAHRAVMHNRWDPQQFQGRRQYGREGVVLASYEHAAFAIGTASRAMRELSDYLAGRKQGRSEAYYGLSDFGDETAAAELGRSAIKLESAFNLALYYYDLLEKMSNAESAEGVNATSARVMGAYATDVAAECVEMAFRRSGSVGLYLPNIFETLLRDIKAAQAHVLVKDPAYPIHGSAVLKEAAARLQKRSNGSAGGDA